MAIVFNKRPKKNPKDQVIKYYAVPKTIKLMELRDIALQVARKETLSEHEVEHVLNSFVAELQFMLLNGYSVRLGDWASFHVTCTSEGTETPEQCTASTIKRVRTQCRFTPEYADKMQKAEWVYAGDLHTTDAK